MKLRILRAVALLILLVNLTSCFMGSWQRYRHRQFFVHKKHYRRMHHWRNRDW